MKKLLIIFSIFGVSVAVGLLLFNNFAPNQPKLFIKSSKISQFQEPFEKEYKKKKSKINKMRETTGYSLKEYYRDLNDFIKVGTRESDELCQRNLKEISPQKEYLDPSSSFFLDGEGREKSINFIAQLNSVSTRGAIADNSIVKIMETEDWDPLEIKTKMSQSVVCQDVDYTNLTHSLIASLKDKKLDFKTKLDTTKFLLQTSKAFAGNRDPIEYKFYAMEILFGLLDNELIAKNHGEDLVLLRQQIIRNVQNFESDFSEKNDKRTNQELLRAYSDSADQVSLEIDDLVEAILNELPQETWNN